jgi:cellulose synthase/poly-beta-1,6-N-acetylglucosamine synthase-like glycosyltransferase
MELLFWLSLALVVYIYVGYPLLIKLLATSKKPTQKDATILPSVTILIAAFNEEDCIAATLQNKVALDYPRDKLEIIVVSDESEDDTDKIVEAFSTQANIPVKLVRQVPRRGKTSGLNIIAPQATGEIIVFSDANSLYAENALKKLVSNFADPTVGYVTGKMVYVNPEGSLVGDGCSSYMKYENWMRALESQIGSIVGVDGGVDAMRQSLYEKLNADQLPDFVQPLKVVEKGFRVVYEPDAILKEEALDDPSREYAMRVRVSLRAIWALHDMRALFNPFRYGIFSLQLLSHKLLRYLAFIPLFAVLIVNILLIENDKIYILLLMGQITFYFLAWVGKRNLGKKDNPAYLSLPYYFSLLNIACMHATWRYLKGEKQVIWKPREG